MYRVFMIVTMLAVVTGISQAAVDKCMPHIAKKERLYHIPQHLLSGMALVESGRVNPKTKRFEPHPYAIQADGVQYFPTTRKEAVEQVQKLQKAGVKNIDVGCLQINLMHHPKAFYALEEAFDPKKNVAYGANLLLELKDKHKTWTKAVGAYHSSTKLLGDQYTRRVYKAVQQTRQKQRAQLFKAQQLKAAQVRAARQARLKMKQPQTLAVRKAQHASASGLIPWSRKVTPKRAG